jgi:hypothetical protein
VTNLHTLDSDLAEKRYYTDARFLNLLDGPLQSATPVTICELVDQPSRTVASFSTCGVTMALVAFMAGMALS